MTAADKTRAARRAALLADALAALMTAGEGTELDREAVLDVLALIADAAREAGGSK